MTSPLVSIVIPTYNRAVMLERLLKSIYSSSYKNIQVIVVDDNSSDTTTEMLTKEFKTKKRFMIHRNKKNLFAAASRNIGLKKSNGKYILFIDDDNVVDKDMIKILVSEIEKNQKIGEIGPVNYSYSKKNKILWSCTKRNMTTSKTNQVRNITSFKHNAVWESDDILNSYMVRTSAIKENKIFFREEYGIMYEESDLAYRIRGSGYKVVVARKAKIFHDIESYSNGKLTSNYMDHFMTDKRRPFVTARNRIIFHSRFSNTFQFVGIVLFWAWIFNLYYAKEFLSYTPAWKISLIKRYELIWAYTKGTFRGILFAFKERTQVL